MYAARKREGKLDQLKELAEVGAKLKMALDLAGRTQPDTVGHRAAWGHADEACSRLMRLITIETPLAPVAEAAAVRVRARR
jgi:hypothetical protein